MKKIKEIIKSRIEYLEKQIQQIDSIASYLSDKCGQYNNTFYYSNFMLKKSFIKLEITILKNIIKDVKS